MKNRKDIGLLVARIIVGGIFIFAGWAKVSDMAGTVGYFGQIGFAPFWAYLVSYVELIGGVMVVLGLWTYLVSMVLAIVMIVAAYVSRSAGIQGMMVPISLLASLIVFATSCGGKYSVMSCKCCDKVCASKSDAPLA